MDFIMFAIGAAVFGWLCWKFHKEAVEKAWVKGFDEGKETGYQQGKFDGTIETIFDQAKMDWTA